MGKKILVTGAAGFIGHHLVEHLLRTTDWELVVFDRLSYASDGFNRLRDIEAFDDKRVTVFTADFTKPIAEGLAQEIGDVNYLIHMGAETHVDNSISGPRKFVEANVMGTFEILEYARRCDSLEKLIYFSTDEVFGPAPEGVAYKEWDRYNSTNPYSATKASGEELCLAWSNTFKVPALISHTMNAFGERQHPEKFIPMVVKRALSGELVPIHANSSKTKAGSRFYIHCRNIASAVSFLLEHGEVRDKYNIVGEQEADNLSLALLIAEFLGKPLNYELVDFHSSRPGHDLRYALDGSKMATMGWAPPTNFRDSLQKTVEWMVRPENARWLSLEKEAVVNAGAGR